MNTLHGAYCAHEERDKESIAVGMLANFVMLAEDPHTVPEERLKAIAIVRTVVGRETMHEA